MRPIAMTVTEHFIRCCSFKMGALVGRCADLGSARSTGISRSRAPVNLVARGDSGGTDESVVSFDKTRTGWANGGSMRQPSLERGVVQHGGWTWGIGKTS